MLTRFLNPKLAVMFTALLPALWAATARGDSPSTTCAADSDCQHGFACTVTSTGACPPVPTCAPGAPCPEVPPCDAGTTKTCVPGSCQADSDCASDMVCLMSATPCESSGEACAADAACPPPSTSTCTTTMTGYCAPRYLAGCHTAADCGPGFTCGGPTACSCGSSGGSSDSGIVTSPPAVDAGTIVVLPYLPADAGAPVLLDEPIAEDGGSFAGDAGSVADDGGGCTCGPIAADICTPNQIACVAASDCPASWTCDPLPGVACSTPVSLDGAVFSCPSVDAGSACEPPYWNTTLAGGASPSQETGSATLGVPGSADAGTTPTAVSADSSAPGNGGGAVSHESPSSSDSGSGGCGVATTGRSSEAGALLVLAGVVLASRRSRKRGRRG